MICQPSFLLSLLSTSQTNNNASSLSNFTVYNSTVLGDQSKNNYLLTIIGLILAMMSTFLYAIATIAAKKLKDLKIDSITLMVYPGYLGVPITLVAAILMSQLEIEKRPVGFLQDKSEFIWQCVYLLISSVFTVLTQLFILLALKHEDPAKVSIIRMSDLFITFVLQSLILDIHANFLSILGAIFIFVSTLLVIVYKILFNKYGKNKNTSTCKKCLFFAL